MYKFNHLFHKTASAGAGSGATNAFIAFSLSERDLDLLNSGKTMPLNVNYQTLIEASSGKESTKFLEIVLKVTKAAKEGKANPVFCKELLSALRVFMDLKFPVRPKGPIDNAYQGCQNELSALPPLDMQSGTQRKTTAPSIPLIVIRDDEEMRSTLDLNSLIYRTTFFKTSFISQTSTTSLAEASTTREIVFHQDERLQVPIRLEKTASTPSVQIEGTENPKHYKLTLISETNAFDDTASTLDLSDLEFMLCTNHQTGFSDVLSISFIDKERDKKLILPTCGKPINGNWIHLHSSQQEIMESPYLSPLQKDTSIQIFTRIFGDKLSGMSLLLKTALEKKLTFQISGPLDGQEKPTFVCQFMFDQEFFPTQAIIHHKGSKKTFDFTNRARLFQTMNECEAYAKSIRQGNTSRTSQR